MRAAVHSAPQKELHAAAQYAPCSDLWTITCVFNPSGYRTKWENYERFARPFRDSGLPLVTVECAFGDAPFELRPGPHTVQVRSQSVLWQKERLLNIGIRSLPREAKKVVWIDGDLLFTNRRWAVQTSELLEQVPFAQPFQKWYRLPQHHTFYRGEGDAGQSFAHTSRTDPQSLWEARHGLAGFAWAARRDVLETHGLYDAAIIGGGDHLIAHAISGTTETVCVRRVVGTESPRPRRFVERIGQRLKPPVLPRKFDAHYRCWADAIYRDVQNNLGATPGDLLHLWHGSLDNRHYHTRHEALQKFDFDPQQDLWQNADGAWEWSHDRPEMQQWALDYFRSRKEDG